MFFDPTVLLLIPALILAVWAQVKVQSAYNEYSGLPTRNGMTASVVARRLLDRFGLNNIGIEKIDGHLTDHYDPSGKVLRLSGEIYLNSSVAAVGIAAHEVGHAIQDANHYAPLTIRNAVVPIAGISSTMAFPLFFIGLFMKTPFLMNLGIVLFLGVVAFHLITLPVELNASSRAIKLLLDSGCISIDEAPGVRKVLNAAAMTYVAATAMSILNLIRLVMLRNSRR